MTADPLLDGRIQHVRAICESSIKHDGDTNQGQTARQWLAQSVLNVLDGAIDEQIAKEMGGVG